MQARQEYSICYEGINTFKTLATQGDRMCVYGKFIVAFAVILVIVLPYASADSPFHFNKVAPENPEINGNFDIVYFGGTPQGNYVEF